MGDERKPAYALVPVHGMLFEFESVAVLPG